MTLFKKNEEYNFNINSDDLKIRIHEYEKEQIPIVSEKIKDIITMGKEFKTKEQTEYIKNLAKVSLFIDSKNNLKGKNLLIDLNYELIVEATFSVYEYLNENYPLMYPNIDKFFEDCNKIGDIGFKNLSNNQKGITTTNGNNIFISKKLEIDNNPSEEQIRILLYIYTHELNHAITGEGLSSHFSIKQLFEMSKESNFQDEELSFLKLLSLQNNSISLYQNMTELETENLMIKMLDKNFRYLHKDEVFTNKLSQGNPLLSTKKVYSFQDGYVYQEIRNTKNVLDFIFEEKLEENYLNKNRNMESLLKETNLEELKPSLINLLDKYQSLYKTLNSKLPIITNLPTLMTNYEKHKFSEKRYEEFIDSYENLIYKYIDIKQKSKELTQDKFFKFVDIIKENPIQREFENVSENEIIVANLYLKLFKPKDKYGDNIEYSSRKELINSINDSKIYKDKDFEKDLSGFLFFMKKEKKEYLSKEEKDIILPKDYINNEFLKD